MAELPTEPVKQGKRWISAAEVANVMFKIGIATDPYFRLSEYATLFDSDTLVFKVVHYVLDPSKIELLEAFAIRQFGSDHRCMNKPLTGGEHPGDWNSSERVRAPFFLYVVSGVRSPRR